MEKNKTHRLTKVAKELGVGVNSIIAFFEKKEIQNLKPNSKISEDQYEMVLNRFGDEKLIKEKIKEQKEIEAQLQKKTISLNDSEKEKTTDSVIEDEEENNADEVFIKDDIIENPEKTKETKEITTKEEELQEEKKEEKSEEELVVEEPKKEKIEEKIEEKTKEEVKEPEKEKIEEKIEEPEKEKIEEKIEKKIEEPEKEKIEAKKEEKTEEKKEEKLEEKKEKLNGPKIVGSIKIEKKPKRKIKVIKKSDKEKIIRNEKTKKQLIEEKPVKITEKIIKEKKNIEKQPEKIIDKKTEEEKQQPKKEETTNKLSGPKVIGKIDLDKMNLKTRPDKKSKKEKEEERKKRQKENRKPKIFKKRPKRKRIDKVKVNEQANNVTKKVIKKKIKTKKKKANVVDEQDVQKQVRETLLKLEQRQKSKAAKFRKEKRKEHYQRKSDKLKKEEAESQILKVTEFITVKEISDLMNVSATHVIEVCFDLGQPVTINYRLNAELINLISDEFKFTVEYVQSSFEEEIELIINSKDNQTIPRPPIVTVMGHVDHGKTSLLDFIRETNVVSGESGGITQHIGAYSVKLKDDKLITFIDTPGHKAFTAMRARGTKVTDIVIIIIAADDSIMPQTEEAIDHARAAGVPMIFAINKVDKPDADPERIKQQLAEKNILVEDWGGKFGSVEISAKKGIGIDELLERIALEAEMLELKANPDRKAIATVLESRLDKGRGYVTNVIVRTGTLKIGEIIVAGAFYGKVKALFNEFNKRKENVPPSGAIQILGLNGAPEPGEPLVAMDNEKEARDKAEQRLQIVREMEFRARKKHSLEEISRRLAKGEKLDLNIIIKADVKGSVDAITDQLTKLSNEEVNVNVVRSAVGQISETDIMLAAASSAIMVGFNVRPSVSARKAGEEEDVEIRLYSVIYDIIDEVKSAVQGMLKPDIKEEIIGSAEVLNLFKVSKVGTIAGSIVRDGKITFANKVRLIRDGIVVYTGSIDSLKRFKDDAREVLKGFECGIGIENFNDVKIGDFIESFKEVEVKRVL